MRLLTKLNRRGYLVDWFLYEDLFPVFPSFWKACTGLYAPALPFQADLKVYEL